MEKKIKIVVAHPGKQHSFRIASALKRDERFEVIYITTVYDKKNMKILNILKKILPQSYSNRINTRKNSDLSDDEVVIFSQIGGLIEIFLSRFDKKGEIYRNWHLIVSKIFGKKVAKFSLKNQIDVIINFDTNSLDCFEYLENANSKIIRIFDASAANRIFMKQVYLEDFAVSNRFANKLKNEIGYLMENQNQKYFQKEISNSQYFLVASSFVKKTFEYSGVEDSQIKICPYGVDLKDFYYKPRTIKEKNKSLNFVFIGGTKQLKGISYLLDAFLKIPRSLATLTIVGNCNLPEELMESYKNIVNFTGRVLQSEVADILQEMDVMVFPSLGDGMGLSVIEALSCGVPVICSENTGAKDLISNGQNGFVIPIQDTEAIIKHVNWFIKYRNLLPEMAEKSHKTALNYTWDNYYKNICETIIDIVKEERI